MHTPCTFVKKILYYTCVIAFFSRTMFIMTSAQIIQLTPVNFRTSVGIYINYVKWPDVILGKLHITRNCAKIMAFSPVWSWNYVKIPDVIPNLCIDEFWVHIYRNLVAMANSSTHRLGITSSILTYRQTEKRYQFRQNQRSFETLRQIRSPWPWCLICANFQVAGRKQALYHKPWRIVSYHTNLYHTHDNHW